MNVLYSVRAKKPIQYDLIKSSNLFSHRNLSLLHGRNDKTRGAPIVVLADEFIYDNLIDEIRSYFNHHNINLHILRISSSEVNKNMDTLNTILEFIDNAKIHRRNHPVLAIGGGVVLDVAGMACSMYRRSIPCIKVPTTLMAYVDAAIGIKNGIDYGGSKNRVGSFDPPYAVILDKGFLETLPHRHIINGLAEIFKVGIITDKSLYLLLKQHGKQAILNNFRGKNDDEILDKSIIGLITELEGNLYETELKRPSDYGHTFSPIIEMKNINTLLHGESVSIDIALTCVIAAHRGLITMELLDDIIKTMKVLDLPTYHPSLNTEMLLEGLNERTLHRNGSQNVPLPTNNWECKFVQDIDADDINHALTYLK